MYDDYEVFEYVTGQEEGQGSSGGNQSKEAIGRNGRTGQETEALRLSSREMGDQSDGNGENKPFEDIIRRNIRIATGETIVDPSLLNVKSDLRFREFMESEDDTRGESSINAPKLTAGNKRLEKVFSTTGRKSGGESLPYTGVAHSLS